MGLQFISFTSAVLLLYLKTYGISAQRPLWPIGEYDMSMYDAAELCHQIDIDKTGTDTSSVEDYLPPIGNCYYFEWIYCPNVPERVESPCGWWVQKICNITEPRVGHDALRSPNPPGVDLPDTIPNKNSEDDSSPVAGTGKALIISPRSSLSKIQNSDKKHRNVISADGATGTPIPMWSARRKQSSFSRPKYKPSSESRNVVVSKYQQKFG